MPVQLKNNNDLPPHCCHHSSVMHLLNTTTKQLELFYGKYIPGYAILSHMWGSKEDEVLFEHIAGSDDDRREGEKRKGYAKIVGACKQAKKDGWEYIWIDTCCINKESSAELSEAINSMYTWYRNSGICYVYLEDVQSQSDGGDRENPSNYLQSDDGNQSSSLQDTQSNLGANLFEIVPFERSRWFKRGWTLQELIAPQHDVFYSKDWTYIGNKFQLRDIISAVTWIRVEMLMAYDPNRASVAERMSWAASRETERDEDIAYCLMGLFGVNMPLLYGEGNKAFRRLQEEIMKNSDDHSLFAWKADFPMFNGWDTRPPETHGLLADSPWNFRDGMDIVTSESGAYSPYSMTNQGLKIKLPLQPIDPKRDPVETTSGKNVFKTTLKCTLRNKEPTRWIVIYLEMIREGYYARIFPHWLNETEISPNINELTSLLIPQVNTFVNRSKPYMNKIYILPTKSGFTIDGHSLEEGYEHTEYDFSFAASMSGVASATFDSPEKRFAVVIGYDNGAPWLDVTDDILSERTESLLYLDDAKKFYEEGGAGYDARRRHLAWLSKKIIGDSLVAVSVRKVDDISGYPYIRAIIDIQNVSEKKRHIPPLVPNNDSFYNGLPAIFDHYNNVHPDSKKEGSDWFGVFNSEATRVFDVSLVHSFSRYRRTGFYTQFSPDGKYLAAGRYGPAKVYDVNSGAEIWSSEIYSLFFSCNGKFFAVETDKRQIKLWNIENKCTYKVFSTYRHIIRPNFSFDGRLLVYGSNHGAIICFWNITDETFTVLNMGTSIVGRSIVISPSIQIWDVTITWVLEKLRKDRNTINRVIFTPDGKGWVLVPAQDSFYPLEYWDINDLVFAETKGKMENSNNIGSFGVREASSALVQRNMDNQSLSKVTFKGNKDYVSSVSVSHDGRWVVSTSFGGNLKFWDLSNATALFTIHGPIHSVSMSPVDNTFATNTIYGKVRIWRYDATSI